MGYAGQLSIGHAAFWGLGAYISGVLTAKFGWLPIPAMAASVFGTCLVGLVVGFPTLKLKGHYLAMATLGVGIIIHIFFVQLDDLTGGPQGLVTRQDSPPASGEQPETVIQPVGDLIDG